MTHLDRSRPIENRQSFLDVLDYIAREAGRLAVQVTNRSLPIDTLTIFTQSDTEYDFVEKLVRDYGTESNFTHGATLYIDSDLIVQKQNIVYLGARRPDITRLQVGYADFPVATLDSFVDEYRNNQFIRPMQSGRGQDMLELRHPDFDVLGYIVEHSTRCATVVLLNISGLGYD